MVKTTIKEVTEKFDKNGTLIERLTREEFIEDDESCGMVSTTPLITTTTYPPYTPATPINQLYAEPYCSNCNNNCYKDSAIATLQELDDGITSISGVNENCTLYGITAHISNIQPLDTINLNKHVTNKAEDTSTENAFKQAVSKCINTK